MRCGGKLIRRQSRNRSASRLWHLSCSPHRAPLPRSDPLLRLSPSLSRSLSQQRDWLDQDDAAGLAAERPFDYHLLEKRMLLKLLHANAPSRCSHPRGQSILAPAGRAAPAHVVKPVILTPAVPALSGAASLPAVPERPLPATPAV